MPFILTLAQTGNKALLGCSLNQQVLREQTKPPAYKTHWTEVYLHCFIYRQRTPKEIPYYNGFRGFVLKKKKFLIQFIGDLGTLSSVGIHFDLFQIVTRGGLFWVIRLTSPLVLEMRRLRLGGEIAQTYLTGGWQRHLGALPPVIFLADRVAYISRANVFSPSLSSTGLSPDRALWERHSGGAANQHPPRKGELPAPSWSSQCMWLGSGWWAAALWHSSPSRLPG